MVHMTPEKVCKPNRKHPYGCLTPLDRETRISTSKEKKYAYDHIKIVY